MKPNDESLRMSSAFGRITDKPGYRHGIVMCPAGIVWAYSQTEGPHTRLDFVWKGRLHMRRFDKYFSALGLARKANQFAKEISRK